MSWILSFLILLVPALIISVIIRLLGVTQPIVLYISAIVSASFTGWFISSAGSAMSTAGPNQAATIRTLFIGLMAGLVAAGAVIFISQLIAKKNSKPVPRPGLLPTMADVCHIV